MADRTLNDISQADFDSAKLLYKELLSTGNPALDLRDGTAISDTVVNPASQAGAYMNLGVQDLRSQMSFKLMQDNPELISSEALDNLAANFNIARKQGLAATGQALVYLTSNQEYTVASGYQLSNSGLRYWTVQAWALRRTVTDTLVQLEIRQDPSGQYYVILPMEAAAVGAAYNLSAGSVLEQVSGAMSNFVSAYAYEQFGGGTDIESNAEFLARIPIAMSHSEFSSQDSIATRLMNTYASVSLVSVTGMGDAEMLRDKHNVFGIAMGGRTDIYLKTFKQPYTRVILKTATKVSDGTYSFTLLPSDAPGLYAIRTITSPYSAMTEETSMTFPAIGSFPFTETRRAYGLESTFHDFGPDAETQALESAYTMWQAVDVVVTSVPPVVSGGTGTYPDTITLKVELYMGDDFDSIQSYVDDVSVRSKESDSVARSAVLAFVSVSADIYRKASAQVDMDAMVQSLADYINSKVFGEAVTLSQLTSVLHSYDIVSVGLNSSEQSLTMNAKVRGADGVWRTMSGSTLDVQDVEDIAAMVSPMTVVFVSDPRHIFLNEKVV